jgi:hypothetical protein
MIIFNLGFNSMGLNISWLEIELVEEQKLTTLEWKSKELLKLEDKVINIKFWCIQENNQLAQKLVL